VAIRRMSRQNPRQLASALRHLDGQLLSTTQELHGALYSWPSTGAFDSTMVKDGKINVRLYDENLRRTPVFVEVPVEDAVATQWVLD